MNSSSGTYHLRSRLWPAVVILLLALQLFWPSRIWTVLLVILGGGWLIAFLWARSLARNLVARRKMRYGWTQVRRPSGGTLHPLERRQGSGNLARGAGSLGPARYNASRLIVINAEGFAEWRTQGVCTRRGLFTIGPANLACSDPLGLYTVNLPISDSAVLLVLLQFSPCPPSRSPRAGAPVKGIGYRADLPWKLTVSAQTVREYVEETQSGRFTGQPPPGTTVVRRASSSRCPPVTGGSASTCSVTPRSGGRYMH